MTPTSVPIPVDIRANRRSSALRRRGARGSLRLDSLDFGHVAYLCQDLSQGRAPVPALPIQHTWDEPNHHAGRSLRPPGYADSPFASGVVPHSGVGTSVLVPDQAKRASRCL
jgi:hypothetical protein